MTVGIVGLGLIGGSMAKAYSRAGHTVLASDTGEGVLDYARLRGAAAGELTEGNAASCELILIALYPRAAIEAMTRLAPHLAKDAFLIDLCGTKQGVCNAGFALAETHGFTFVGGHPMAGTQYSGFKHARADLFEGASLVIVPPRRDDIFLLERVKELMAPAGFGHLTVTDAATHDRQIAFTSQLAHVVSNAYVKSPTARSHAGFSAGSYRDLTRVARLNPDMWTELFLENREFLGDELEFLIEELDKYRRALADGDADTLRALLADGSARKIEIDGGKK